MKWPYADVAATPFEYLPLCEEMGWKRADLLAVPKQSLRDFVVIHQYDQKINANR